MEVSGVAQWPTGEGRAVTCLDRGKGAMGCEWHRWPRFGTESQCWGCERPELPALATKAAGIRHNPMAGQCQHTPTTCGRRKAGC